MEAHVEFQFKWTLQNANPRFLQPFDNDNWLKRGRRLRSSSAKYDLQSGATTQNRTTVLLLLLMHCC